MDPDKTLADWAERDLLRFNADMCREEAAVVLAMWDRMRKLRQVDAAAADEVTELVLARFSPAEPPMVPGRDWLAEATADAAVLVREIRDDWENDFSNCPRCGKPRENRWTTHCDTCDGEAVDRG